MTTLREVLASHRIYAEWTSGNRYEDACPCGWRGRDGAQHQANMLAAAGLLADPTTRTETEWGVACPLDDDVIPTADPDWSVRHHDRNCGPGHRLVRRTVTDWAPAEENEHG